MKESWTQQALSIDQVSIARQILHVRHQAVRAAMQVAGKAAHRIPAQLPVIIPKRPVPWHRRLMPQQNKPVRQLRPAIRTQIRRRERRIAPAPPIEAIIQIPVPAAIPITETKRMLRLLPMRRRRIPEAPNRTADSLLLPEQVLQISRLRNIRMFRKPLRKISALNRVPYRKKAELNSAIPYSRSRRLSFRNG